ncbi:MAG: cytochrome c biogenesis protein CcdA [Planctomycetaceae bacterium]|nr:cytochrome c biogenesis protein CcdA [Planctomycetaceae bacterium]
MDRFGLHSALVVAWLLATLALPAGVQAQSDLQDLLGGKKSVRSKSPKAEFTATVSPQSIRPGETVAVSITARLPDGYYIYGTDGKFAGRTRIALSSPQAEPIDDDFLPDHAGKTSFDPDLKVEVTKFPGGVTWTRKYRVSGTATGSDVRFTGKLEGQYCNSSDAGGQCIPIIPAHKIDVVAQLVSTTPAALTSRYVMETRPMRKSSGEPQPDPIAYRFRLSPEDALPGGQVTLSVTAMIDEGWHTYSLSQTGLGAAPTEIDVTLRNLEPVGEGFEADKPYVIEQFGDITLQSHYNVVTWSRQFRVTGDRRGDYSVAGDVTYVVCKENVCKPLNVLSFAVGMQPETPPPVVAVSLPEEIPSPFAQAIEPPVEDVVEPAEPAMNGARVAEITLQWIEGGGAAAEPVKTRTLWPFLLLCIGGGLLALLTPCSFPMVPITVSFFLKQSELNHKRPWLLALVYCGSIVLAFTGLGVGISAVFGATKLNELANNAWLNIAIGGVFIAFGLNMLGAFEIRIPSSLLSWSAGHESGGSYLGAVFMALTFTLTSFTCTFAVAGSLLVSASQGEYYWPIVGMLAFGTAFAAPFFILALLPGLLKKLPKSGGWMNSVKVVMGLIEFGAAVKFFSVADLAWNPAPVLFDFVTTMLIWLVLSLGIALYLLGIYRFAHDTPTDSISTTRGLLAFGFLGLTAMIGYLILQPERAAGVLMQQIVAFAPPDLNSIAGDVGPQVETHGIKFALDLEQALPVARNRRQPLLLDFTGVNCINCRRMEKIMAEADNKRRMSGFIPVQLYADKVPAITNADLAERILARNLERQVNWFGDVSLPSYAVVTPDGKEILAAYIGYEQREGHFGKFLEYGWKQWEARQAQARQVGADGVLGR